MSPDLALNISAVYCAVKIISETIAQVPKDIKERKGRFVEVARGHPIYDVLVHTPNGWMTSFEFFEMMGGHLALRGNFFAKILEGPRGFADQLIPLHPDRVSVRQNPDTYRLIYEVTPGSGGTPEVLTQDEIFHVRGLSSDGITGTSVVSLFRNAAGLALATEKYGSELFTSDAAVRGILTHPGTLSPEARKNIRASINDQKNGTMLLEEGLSWEKVGMSAEDAQFLMTRRFQIEEFARWFNIPPHMLKDLEKATFSNIEEQGLEFVKYTMLPWFRRIEEAVRRDLIIRKDQYFFKFNVEGLLRGDSKARAEFYDKMVTNGTLTRNEVREKEDYNPLPGLDAPLQALNMAPAGEEQFRGIVHSAAKRAANRETLTLRRSYEKNVRDHGDSATFYHDVHDLYDGLPAFLADAFAAPVEWFREYAEANRDMVVKAMAAEDRGQLVSTLTVIKRIEEHGADLISSIIFRGVERLIDERAQIEN